MLSTPAVPAADLSVVAFIERWQQRHGSELSTSQSFIIELCELLGVARPHATADQGYMFERPITFTHGDGSTSHGRVDCYRRGCFVWESKKLNATAGAGAPRGRRLDDALMRARAQAEAYARALPASEGRPPFVVVVDVGNVIELYAEFSRSGATYTPFPDARSHRIALADLVQPKVRERLRLLWLDPLALDPARVSAKVTRQVAGELAELAKSLEGAGHAPQRVAAFLTRCLFSMFAEDIGLLPRDDEGQGGFVSLLTRYRTKPERLAKMLHLLWHGMDVGGPNGALEGEATQRFNGKLFKGWNEEGYVLALSPEQVDGLLRAARANWCEVEPAIFGTLLERALDPTERHALGAHYTPRAYVERLVLPTVVEPLRADWVDAQAAALVLQREAEALPEGKKREDKRAEAVAELRRFHHQLCSTRVLDPACGSGNFLYVTLEHLKRLEGEVLARLEELGHSQSALALEGETVTVAQLRGLELNPRAAALAELVLWIGWLQWQVRTSGLGSVAEPVVHDYGNIECRDAVLAWDGQAPATDEAGRVLTRWDGVTKKPHPVTGELVPDEAAQVPQWRYVNPRAAQWPEVDFIVGNPPFIGKLKMREALGDGYVEALRKTYSDVPDSADLVMYWWHKAADSIVSGSSKKFGLITTNSISQKFNRRVIEEAFSNGLGIVFAIPDHPWVDVENGAAVRVSMTVAEKSQSQGVVLTVVSESTAGMDGFIVDFVREVGKIHSDLKIGANVANATQLLAMTGITSMGVMLAGGGFIVDDSTASLISEGLDRNVKDRLIREYRNGRDLMDKPRLAKVIDTFGFDVDELSRKAPGVFQHLLDYVKPERSANRDKAFREKWWLHGRSRGDLRQALAGVDRFIVTVETAKHRVFQFLDKRVIPDHRLIAIAISDAMILGLLSSTIHNLWALRAGGTLEDRPVYNKTRCFDTFPFPSDDTGLTPELAQKIGQLAEQIDAHRKARQAAHDDVTLTGLYNVLDKLRRQEPLTAKDKTLHTHGLVSVLQTLHHELDTAVLQAYGWADLGPVPWHDDTARQTWTDTLLQRLVDLNTRRAAEEAAGHIRWLRPEFQDPARRHAATPAPATADAQPTPQQAPLPGLPTDAPPAADDLSTPDDTPSATAPSAPIARQPWPAGLPQQTRAVADALAAHPAGLSLPDLAERFTGRGPWKKSLPTILDVLESIGRARRLAGSAVEVWQVVG